MIMILKKSYRNVCKTRFPWISKSATDASSCPETSSLPCGSTQTDVTGAPEMGYCIRCETQNSLTVSLARRWYHIDSSWLPQIPETDCLVLRTRNELVSGLRPGVQTEDWCWKESSVGRVCRSLGFLFFSGISDLSEKIFFQFWKKNLIKEICGNQYSNFSKLKKLEFRKKILKKKINVQLSIERTLWSDKFFFCFGINFFELITMPLASLQLVKVYKKNFFKPWKKSTKIYQSQILTRAHFLIEKKISSFKKKISNKS